MALEIFLHRAVGPLACNCFVVGDPETKQAIVIDPGGDAAELASAIESLGVSVSAIVATHAHFDHILAAEELRLATGAPFLLHDADRPLLDWMNESGRLFLGIDVGEPPDVDSSAGEGDLIRAGAVELEVLHTPGHSPGSISLVSDEAVFAGDTLFNGSVGRTDLPGGNPDELVRAVREKLFPLGDLPVYPGHGPATTLDRERRDNPFVGESRRLWLPPN